MIRPVSSCCAASLAEEGRTVTYWTCRECGEVCDAAYSSDVPRLT